MPTFLYDTRNPGAVPANITPDQIDAAMQAVTNARITGSVGARVIIQKADGEVVAYARRLYTVDAGIHTATDVWTVDVQGGRPHPVADHDRQVAAMYDGLALAVELTEGGILRRWAELDMDDRETIAGELRPVLPFVLGAVRS